MIQINKMTRRDAQPEGDFVLARASQTAPPPARRAPREDPRERSCDSAGERSGERFPPSWAARHSPDVDLDGEILAWIASHVPSHKRLKTPH